MSFRLGFIAGTTAANFYSTVLYTILKTDAKDAAQDVARMLIGGFATYAYVGYTFGILPGLISSLEPSRAHWISWGYGTTVTAAVSAVAFKFFKGSVAPWGKTSIACQIVFSIAVGYFYTDLFDHNRYLTQSIASKSQKDNLLPTKDQNTLREFTAKLRTTPPEKLETLLTETPLLRLAGNDMVETLASHLPSLDGHYEISFPKPTTIPLDQFSKDHLQHLSKYLSIYELLTLSMTCKKMFHAICGAEGVNVWRNKKVGSLSSFRNMTLLAKSLDTQTRASKNPAFLLQATVLKQALFLAWPQDLIQRIGKHLSTSQDFKDGISLLWLNEDPHRTLTKLLAFVKQPKDMVLAARFLREHPDCFDAMEELNISKLGSLFELIIRFGLPRSGLDAFCNWFKAELVKNNEDQQPLQTTDPLLKTLQRISIDHPDYLFEGKLPPAIIPGIYAVPIEKPYTIYLNQQIVADLSQLK